MTPAREREIRDRLDAMQASRHLGDHPARWAWELLREVDALREERRADARLREALRLYAKVYGDSDMTTDAAVTAAGREVEVRARIEAIVGPLDAPEEPVTLEPLTPELLAALEANPDGERNG